MLCSDFVLDRMDVIEINLIFFKLASDYDLSRRQNLCPPEFNFLRSDMPLSAGDYSVAPPIMRPVIGDGNGECLMSAIL